MLFEFHLKRSVNTLATVQKLRYTVKLKALYKIKTLTQLKITEFFKVIMKGSYII